MQSRELQGGITSTSYALVYASLAVAAVHSSRFTVGVQVVRCAGWRPGRALRLPVVVASGRKFASEATITSSHSY